MLQNYLTTTLRSIFKNKAFSLINVTGLAISISVCLLIIMIIKDQYSFDRFHSDSERIYRVNTSSLRKDNSREDYATTVAPLGDLLKENYPQIEKLTMLHFGLRGEFKTEEKALPVRGYFTDQEFFEVFSFEVDGIDASIALSEPFTVLLTDTYAKNLFGDSDPIGKTVVLNEGDGYKVIGTIRMKDVKTHLEFEALASSESIPALVQKGTIRNFIDDWSDIYATYIYLKLKPGISPQTLESQFLNIARRNYQDVVLESRTKAFSFFLQPLNKITPGPIYSNNMGTALPLIVLNILAIFSILILLTACFNFTNLSIAKSLKRAKEVGMRKIQGAARKEIFFQFIGESLLYALVSTVVAYVILQFLIPAFSRLELAGELNIAFKEEPILYLYFMFFAIACGLIAGFLPAWYLSSFNPLSVIRNSRQISLKKGPWITRMNIRKSLMVLQFGLCLLFIFMAILSGRQVRFMMNKEIGIKTEDIVDVQLRDVDFNRISTVVNNIPGVIKVSGISIALGTWADQSSDYRKNYMDEQKGMRDFFVDRNYIENLDIQLLAGQNFPTEVSDEREQFVILNEKAIEFFNWESSSDALGQGLIIGDSTEVQVIGVMKDFNFRPMTYNIGPMAFRYSPSRISIMNVRIGKEYREKTFAQLEETWNKFDPDHLMDWQYMDTEIRDSYDYFRDMEKVLGFFGFLAISIASLGLLGMVIFTLQTKIQEVGIRKILGASRYNLFIHLSKEFLLLLLLSLVIFLPLSIILGNQYLNSFAFKIEVGVIIIGLSILIILGIGFLTIVSQVVRTANVNPVDILRRE